MVRSKKLLTLFMYTSKSRHVYTLIYLLSYSWNETFHNHKNPVMFICSHSVFPVVPVPDNLSLIFFPCSIAFFRVSYIYNHACEPLLSFNIWNLFIILCKSLGHCNQNLTFMRVWSIFMNGPCIWFPVFLKHKSTCTW